MHYKWKRARLSLSLRLYRLDQQLSVVQMPTSTKLTSKEEAMTTSHDFEL